MKTCGVKMRRGDAWHARWVPCGKSAKGVLQSGEPACGLHLNVEKKRMQSSASRDEWFQRIDRLEKRLGVSLGGRVGIDSTVSMTIAAAEALADRLEGKK